MSRVWRLCSAIHLAYGPRVAYTESGSRQRERTKMRNTITITLGDDQLARLRELAERHGQTPEQAAAALLESLLPRPDHFWGAGSPPITSALDLSGLVDDPTIPTLNSDAIDRLLAAEAAEPHTDGE